MAVSTPMFRRVLVALGVVSALGAISLALAASRAEREETYRKLEIFARVLNYVQSRFVDETDPSGLVYAAARGLVGALDARSAFLTPAEVRALRAEARRIHFDLGFEWSLDAEGVRIDAVRSGSAAARRGVRAGQRIVAIDGDPPPASLDAIEDRLYDLRADAKVLKLAGPDGEVVRLRLAAVDMVRPTLEVQRRPDGVVHLRIRRFTEATAAELLPALEAAAPIRGLVLDLRGNSGGVVDAAARTVDAWLADGVIATTEARREVVETFVAHARGTQPDYPLALVVDEETASAAELVVLALQESGRARVFGAPTFGKGSVQTVIELEDGAALRLTVSRWFSASHRNVEGTGVRPDREMDPAAALDAAMDAVAR